MYLDYDGDEGNRIVSWFREHLRAIATCLKEGLPEASLALIYSGIDTLGLLAAPAGVADACGKTFQDWCEKYLLPRLESIAGDPLMAVDLYGARCGILHTSTPLSSLERKGKAHQIGYRFLGKTGMTLIASTQRKPLGLDIQNLAMAFREGGLAFLGELKHDQARFQNAGERAQHFLRWGTGNWV